MRDFSKWICKEREENTGAVLFRKTFTLEKDQILASHITATALGTFELYVNGKRVGNNIDGGIVYDEMKPGWTDYRKRVLSFTYDLSDYIVNGENCILAVVADGWWQGRISYETYPKAPLCFRAEMEYIDVHYRTSYIATDLSWECMCSECVVLSDIWDGEIYDSNKPGFEELSLAYNYSKWLECGEYHSDALISAHPFPFVRIRKELTRSISRAYSYRKIADNGSDYGSVVIDREIKATPFLIKKGETVVVDFGQEIVGREFFKVKGEKNTCVNIRFAEMLNDSGLKSRGNDGAENSIYTANYRSAKAQNKYILHGSQTGEEYSPKLTFFGFRYIEISADEDVEILELCANVIGSEIEETGYIETSDLDVNRLIENIFWGQRGNYFSIPTDCPQRDERLGWTGDTQVFCNSGAYNGDVRGFFTKWLQDLRDSQFEDGAISDVVPPIRILGGGNAAWADAAIIVPYTMYKMYGDRKFIKDSYSCMVKYMDFLSTRGLQGPLPTFGDWLSYARIPNEYISVCYYAYDALLMHRMSQVMSKTQDDIYYQNSVKYLNLYNEIKTHFKSLYIDSNSNLKETSQCACVLALKFGLVDGKEKDNTINMLEKALADNCYRLNTGFVGTAYICDVLGQVDRNHLAYTLLLQTEEPSWLYCVLNGATTVWERWNSYTKDKGFGDVSMNSFNHYAYGAVIEWMYKYMAGICPDEAHPGFEHIILQPRPDFRDKNNLSANQKNITYVKAHYDSVRGRIKSEWSTEKGYVYKALVPEGTSASLSIPCPEEYTFVTVNGQKLCLWDIDFENGYYLFELESGEHTFVFS